MSWLGEMVRSWCTVTPLRPTPYVTPLLLMEFPWGV